MVILLGWIKDFFTSIWWIVSITLTPSPSHRSKTTKVPFLGSIKNSYWWLCGLLSGDGGNRRGSRRFVGGARRAVRGGRAATQVRPKWRPFVKYSLNETALGINNNTNCRSNVLGKPERVVHKSALDNSTLLYETNITKTLWYHLSLLRKRIF